MKIKTIFSTLLLGLIVTTTSCTKDNYDAPESTLMGRIVYIVVFTTDYYSIFCN